MIQSCIAKEFDQSTYLLLHEDLQEFYKPKTVAFEHRTVTPELVSRLTEPLVLKEAVLSEGLSLCSIKMLASPSTCSQEEFPPIYISSFWTVVYGSQIIEPEGLPQSIQLGRLYWVPQMRRDLLQTRLLRANWDGEGAKAIDEETFRTASSVLEKIVARSIGTKVESRPAVVPLSDGSIRFEWTVKNRELFLTVSQDSIEAQRWEPLVATTSEYYLETDINGVQPELEWLTA